jgi:integrase
MSYVSMFLGLRASEALALRWEDFDFFEKSVHIQRSVVGKHDDTTKTEDSEAHLPLPAALVGILERWRAFLPSVSGWLFGNPATGRPYHRDSIVADHLKPAGERAGIPGLGSHSFRHSYRAFMAENDVAAEWQKRLMRHSNIEMTMSYGNHRLSPEMREGNERVVEMVMWRTAKEKPLDVAASQELIAI